MWEVGWNACDLEAKELPRKLKELKEIPRHMI
jgi:hypothetical protein